LLNIIHLWGCRHKWRGQAARPGT